MRKRGERCLVLLTLLIVFCCLLLSGGSRLIGREGEETRPPLSPAVLRSVLCSAPISAGETGCLQKKEHPVRTQTADASIASDEPGISVCSDANGNVLGRQTYLHTVYQAFSLGDGFA